MTVDELQEFVHVRPFLSWLGIKVLAIGDETVEARATWRPEWVTSPTLMQTHGGILAALIDFAADFSLEKAFLVHSIRLFSREFLLIHCYKHQGA